MAHERIPFSQFVVKIHSRCDLACDHCYVYEHADQSWYGRPLAMDSRTAARVAERIAEHASTNRLSSVRIVLHGGEPLLVGVSHMAEILRITRETVETGGTRLDLRIHTNGVLLNDAYCRIFDEYGVRIGVSLDGDRRANDRHRRYRDGRSSYDKVAAALSLLRSPEYRHLYAGLLCTIDIQNNPLDVYQGLVEHEPPRIDLLLPHATWVTQPPGLLARRGLDDPQRGGLPDGRGEYGAWLRRLFDAWDAAGRPVPIRIFDSIIGALHGRPSQTESLGLVPADLLVIETDGSLEQADSLKTAYDGAPATGLNVFDHELDAATTHPGIRDRQQGAEGLCARCRACPVVAVCGGGLYAHRYEPGGGFHNPSVYCADLFDLITHIQDGTSMRSPAPGGVTGETSTHALSLPEFDALARGYGDADAIRRLGEAQESIRRRLLARIAETGPQHDTRFTRAWDLLATLDQTHPAAVSGVLAHPYVRVWAVDALEHPENVAHLASIAASAALRAGVAATLTLPVLDGAVRLPTLGALTPDPGAAEAVVEIGDDGMADIRVGDAVYRIAPLADHAAARADSRWQPQRRLVADGLDAVLEDTDPYRTCHGFAAGRLPAEEANRWDGAFREAVAFADKHLPSYAPGLRAGLVAVMPMERAADGTHRSAAARHAFGAVGAARPDDPDILALLLVHEFQHVKLGALLDLFDLYDTEDTADRYYAPWRPDPRPLEGLLQGTYAHIAVTEFWRVRRELPGADRAADAHFARWREHTYEAVNQLLAAGSLTPLGTRLVEAMGETAAPWLDEPVGGEALAAARESARRHRDAFERATGLRG